MSATPTLSQAGQRARIATPGSGVMASAIAVIAAAVMTTLGYFMSGGFDQATWLDSPSDIVAFYHGSGSDERVAGAFMVGFGFLLLLVFFAKLADLIGAADPPSAWLGRLILAVAGVDAAVILVAVAALSAPIWRAAHGGLSDEGFLILNDVQFAFGLLSLLASAVLAITLGIAILRSGLVPRWLGWALVADGVVFILAEASPLLVWDVAYGMFLGLLVVMGVVLLVGRQPEAPSAVGRSRS